MGSGAADITEVSLIEKLLFGLTRWLVIAVSIISILLIIAAVVVLVRGTGIFSTTKVSYDDVQAAVNSSKQTVSGQPSQPGALAATSYSIPDNVKPEFQGDNRRILNEWLDSLSDDAQRQDFLDNLSAVISDAKSRGVSDLTDTINSYRTIKFGKIEKSPYEQYVQVAERGAAAVAIISLLFLLILASLVLVLLAIERHTRRALMLSPRS